MLCWDINNNNNYNNWDKVYSADRMAPDGHIPLHQANWLES